MESEQRTRSLQTKVAIREEDEEDEDGYKDKSEGITMGNEANLDVSL